jgi:NADH-quinone oxidoreductase subunit F
MTRKLETPSDLGELRERILRGRDSRKPCITICSGTGCHAFASEKVAEAFEKELKTQGIESRVDIRRTGCHGFCEKGPLVVLFPEGVCYLQVKPQDVPDIVSSSINGEGVVERLLYTDTAGNRVVREAEIPFYKNQTRIIFGNNSHLDPRSLDDYISLGGYMALPKALSEMAPEQVIDAVTKSGLRGRGGAGFPTGVKWGFCRKAQGSPKYLICNADEGDPGAYMDRSLLEGNPHSVLEGMIVAGYAIGAPEAFVYVRAEYPLAMENVGIAIKQAEEHGLLGENILGSGFNFSVHIHVGAGAFVCGEETALMASIEGRRGTPRSRPPFPAQSGLWGKPTNINNVETFANVPLIINNGYPWYAAIGTEKSKGTKIFSLVGKVNNTGLVEVPMGASLRQIVFDIGGGIPGNKAFKAVQTGGPSGGCLPAHLLDLPVDYDSLTGAGAIMGSGGMVVMDEETCMVDLARYFLSFTQAESCGKCVPCRLGTKQMLDILERITKGEGKPEEVDLLAELAESVKRGSLCGLGQTAPNPVLTTIRYFRDEYEAHVNQKRCPALTCKALVSYYILPDKCQACMICARNCPTKAIKGGRGLVHVIDQGKCTKCGTCLEVCPSRFAAVVKVSGEKVEVPSEPAPVVRKPKTASA